jgi:hypothetical protein
MQVLEKRIELQRDLYPKWDDVVVGDGHGGISRDIQLLVHCGSSLQMNGGTRLAVLSSWLKTIQHM